MKKLCGLFLVFSMVLSLTGCVALLPFSSSNKLEDFYENMCETQNLLDDVADTIYENWYDAIYNDEFGDDINVAIAAAQVTHQADLERIEALDTEIADLFKDLKDDKSYGETVKKVMSAYSDYYELVVNVSGSYKSYSEKKETLKKDFASALKELSYEL